MPACPSCGHSNREGARFCEACGSALAAASAAMAEQRKTVTVLFCDLAGSTALGESLDPERLRVLLARYFERMKEIVERHGGSVEKFIGDAVMAVFGVPVLHEDDALRAVRSAVEMRDAWPELGLEGRIGVMTGEVVTGTEERLATGDAVNVAARLEQAAHPGEVLIGVETLALVRDATEVEPVEPLELKGKTEPVSAYRLLRLREPERRHEAVFVGRERELELLRDAWERVQAEQRCELVTVLGDAGVGKSRLVAEHLHGREARVVRGRCLPYGEGITYWPVVEVLKQLDVLPSNEVAAAAIRSLLGETEAATSAEEIAWAFRKTLEQAARKRPLVVVFEDVHWGEETFLDLIEHVALLSSGASILLLLLARPELAERRPSWPVTLRLEPLDDADVEELIPERIHGGLRERIARAAGGNPLFVWEMLAMAADAKGEVIVPPTLQALLGARLDQLETAERSVLERGAVEGEVFHRGAVQALAPDETQVTPRLAALVRKELISPYMPQLPGEDGFRFRHLLIRDAAYDALPKSARAELHERFAAWLEVHGADLVELDEILGYHLEQACEYHAELGLSVEDELMSAARARLTAAGRRASSRWDGNAAVNFLERAAALLPRGGVDIALELDLAYALFFVGKGEHALRCAASLSERGAAVGNHVAELSGRIEEERLRTYLEPEGAGEQLAALAEQALPVFEAASNDVALFSAYRALATAKWNLGRMDAACEALERAEVHAQHAGLPSQLVHERDGARFHGTTPASELLAWQDQLNPGELRNQSLRRHRAVTLAMLGRFDEARAILADLRVETADRGDKVGLANFNELAFDVELLHGDPTAAIPFGEEACGLMDELGHSSYLSTQAGNLARALCSADRLEEADVWARRAAELGASDDAATQMLWRQARAEVLARCGEQGEAEELAREAVAIGEQTDMLNAQADAHADLADVLFFAGKTDQAVETLEEAVARYERKGNLVSAERTKTRIAEIRPEPPPTNSASARRRE